MKIDSSAPKEKLSSLIDGAPVRRGGLLSGKTGAAGIPELKLQEQLQKSIDSLLGIRFPGSARHLQSLIRELVVLTGRLPAGAQGGPEDTQERRLLLNILKAVLQKDEDIPGKAVKDLRVLEKYLEQKNSDQSILLYPPDGESGQPEIRIEEQKPENSDGGWEESSLRMTFECSSLGRITVTLGSLEKPSGNHSRDIHRSKTYCRIAPKEKKSLNLIKKNRGILKKRLQERGLLPDQLKISLEGSGRNESGPEGEKNGDEGVELWG